MLQGWIAQIAGFLLAKLGNVFPNLVGVFGSIVSSFSKEEAQALHGALVFFHDQLANGADWETAVTATLNELGTAEYQVLTDVGKHLLQAFMQKSKT